MEKVVLIISVFLVLLGLGQRVEVKQCETKVEGCTVVLLDSKIEEVSSK